MKVRRLQKFVFSFGIILSLFSASFAACVCSHHATPKADEHASSCHQNSAQTENSKIAGYDAKSGFPGIEENCSCFTKISQPFTIGKSENVKAQKTLAILPVQIKVDTFESTSKNETAKIHFEYYFYNSNYLKRLTPPRAPPVL